MISLVVGKKGVNKVLTGLSMLIIGDRSLTGAFSSSSTGLFLLIVGCKKGIH